MLDLRDAENSNWIKNVGQKDEDEDIEKSSPLLTLQDWLDKQSHDDLRPTNPPSRPPRKGAIWNRETHRWSKGGTADLDKQQAMKRGWHDHEGQVEPHPGNVKDHEAYFEEQKEVGAGEEESDEDRKEESDEDREERAKKLQKPQGGPITQILRKFNSKIEKILKTLDDLMSGRVEEPQQAFESLKHLKEEIDTDIKNATKKIDDNGQKINDLHESGKIDDETKERADTELESLRQHYKEQEKEVSEKWDGNLEDLKKKLSLEEQESEEEEPEEEQPEPEAEPEEEESEVEELEEEDDKDNIFERHGDTGESEVPEEDEEDPQWEASAKNSGEHDAATSAGWGGKEHDEEDFHPETGELQVPGKNANDVREWAKKLEERYGIDLIGGPTGNEPHDDIYKHFGFEGGHMGGNPITANHVAAYVHSKTDEYDRPSFNKEQRREFDRDNAPESSSGKEEQSEVEETKPEEPTVESNAQSLLDRTTDETKELKETRKGIEERQKSLESELEEIGDDDTESREQITGQLADAKNKVDVINTSIQSQTRKTEMANAILTKKPSLNGEETPKAEESDEEPKSSSSKNRKRLKMMNEKGMMDDEEYQEIIDLLDIKDLNDDEE